MQFPVLPTGTMSPTLKILGETLHTLQNVVMHLRSVHFLDSNWQYIGYVYRLCLLIVSASSLYPPTSQSLMPTPWYKCCEPIARFVIRLPVYKQVIQFCKGGLLTIIQSEMIYLETRLNGWKLVQQAGWMVYKQSEWHKSCTSLANSLWPEQYENLPTIHWSMHVKQARLPNPQHQCRSNTESNCICLKG